MKNMNFRDMKAVEIQPDYTISVVKEAHMKEVENFPLEALATSERVTLGLILLAVAKKEFLPEFPFFVVDEVVTAYDPTRFNKIKEYIKSVAPYVIVTQLSDNENIEIEYEG